MTQYTNLQSTDLRLTTEIEHLGIAVTTRRLLGEDVDAFCDRHDRECEAIAQSKRELAALLEAARKILRATREGED